VGGNRNFFENSIRVRKSAISTPVASRPEVVGEFRPRRPRSAALATTIAHILHTKALGFRSGEVADEISLRRGAFTGTDAAWHINVKKVPANRLSLTAFASSFAVGNVVRVITDSRVALHVVIALVSQSVPLCAEVRRLHAVAHRLGVTLEADWILLTSKKWRFRSGCNHSTAFVDQWKDHESCEFLTQSPHAALRTGNAHQDLQKSEEIC